MRAIIFANGNLNDPDAVRSLLREGDLIIAANGGTLKALEAGLTPHLIIGDMDSLDPNLVDELAGSGRVRLIPHPPMKDETDLELAILYAVDEGADEILLLAALGGRLDQTVANLLLLAHPGLEGVRVSVVEGDQEAFLIRSAARIAGRPGDLVSLIPLGRDAVGVTAEGLRWPLRDETLRFGLTRGVSNLLLSDEAQVSVREGMLLCVVTRRGKEIGRQGNK